MLDWRDFLSGFFYGLVTCFAVGPAWGIVWACYCALLWALGGAGFLDSNAWRRFGVPVIIFAAFKWHNPSGWPYLGLLTTISALSIGYGEPDLNDPKGSPLGRRFGRWTRPVWWTILALATVPMFIK